MAVDSSTADDLTLTATVAAKFLFFESSAALQALFDEYCSTQHGPNVEQLESHQRILEGVVVPQQVLEAVLPYVCIRVTN